MSKLAVGTNIRGAYRGERTHTIPSVDNQPDVFLARVSLDTDDEPVAAEVNETAIAHIKGLDVADGEVIVISRAGEDICPVVHEASE